MEIYDIVSAFVESPVSYTFYTCPMAEQLFCMWPLGGAKSSNLMVVEEGLFFKPCCGLQGNMVLNVYVRYSMDRLQEYQIIISTFPGDYVKDYRITYRCCLDMDCVSGLSRNTEQCLSWFSSMFSLLSPRYTAPPQTLINHSTHRVTFALFKKILQTLAFRKYNYLPFHISAANIPAL